MLPIVTVQVERDEREYFDDGFGLGEVLLVLGGLDNDVVTKTYTKVPFLGDLPGIGYAFRSDAKSDSKDRILIFVTPTIIQDSDFQPAQTTFLAQKGAAPSNIKEPIWDTGEPYDWTKPKSDVKPDYQP